MLSDCHRCQAQQAIDCKNCQNHNKLINPLELALLPPEPDQHFIYFAFYELPKLFSWATKQFDIKVGQSNKSSFL